jgi:hypothetical protein
VKFPLQDHADRARAAVRERMFQRVRNKLIDY